MTTYNTYQEAKIANPDSEIVTTGQDWQHGLNLKGKFERLVKSGPNSHVLDDSAWIKCNPADYCMSVEAFQANGYKLVDGDLYISIGGCVITYTEGYEFSVDREPSRNSERFILRAAALKQAEIDTAPNQVESLTLRETSAHETLEKAIDEVESAMKRENAELKGVINAGREAFANNPLIQLSINELGKFDDAFDDVELSRV